VRFGTQTAKVTSWSATKIVVIVPSMNVVSVSLKSHNERIRWYSHEREVLVTVTPKGAAASNGVEFEMKSSSRRSD
jgi:hypothetical protein